MNIFVDLATIGLLIFGLAYGARRGFIKSIASVIVFVASIIGAKYLSAIVADPIADFVYPKIAENVSAKIRIGAIDPSGIDVVDEVIRNFTGSASEALDATTRAFVDSAVRAAAFLLCFVVLSLLLHLLMNVVDKIFDLPILRSVNGILGAVLGLGETVLLMFLVPYVLGRMGIDWCENLSEGSVIFDYFVHNSPFDLIKLLSS